MIKKSSDIVLATSFLGTILLPVASHWLQRPFIPSNMERIGMTIADLCIYCALGLILGLATGCAIVYKQRGNLTTARNIRLGSGVLVAGWLEFYTVVFLCGSDFSAASYQHYPNSLWLTIEIIGEIPAWLWAIVLIVLGVIDHQARLEFLVTQPLAEPNT